MFKKLFVGSRITSHQKIGVPNEPSTEHSVSTLLEPYIEEAFGPAETVFHEIVSDEIHVDVYFIPPTKTNDRLTLVTSGMSGKPMTTPKGRERFGLAELVAFLPSNWPVGQSEFASEENYWPVRCLKTLARFPHEHKTWLSVGHTIPNGNPPVPYAPNTELCCALLAPIILKDGHIARLSLGEKSWVDFLQVVPIFRSEMELQVETRS